MKKIRALGQGQYWGPRAKGQEKQIPNVFFHSSYYLYLVYIKQCGDCLTFDTFDFDFFQFFQR